MKQIRETVLIQTMSIAGSFKTAMKPLYSTKIIVDPAKSSSNVSAARANYPVAA
jgi:hypothetical protein